MAGEKIKSLNDVSKWIERSRKKFPPDGYLSPIFFYRGENQNYRKTRLKASVYRSEEKCNFELVDYEFTLYQEMLRRSPLSFSNDKTVLERLIRMQHYGLDTRLLDVTQNPLVALFFACDGHKDENKKENRGWLFLFPVLRFNVSFLANLDEFYLAGLENTADVRSCAETAYYKIRKKFEDIIGMAKVFALVSSERFRNELNGFSFSVSDNEIPFMQGTLDFVSSVKKVEEDINEFIEKPIWKELDNAEAERFFSIGSQIKEYKSQVIEEMFDELGLKQQLRRQMPNKNLFEILPKFYKPKFVYAPMNNERVNRQQGAFVIHPSSRYDSSMYDLLEDNGEEYTFKPLFAIVENKSELLKELAEVGITRSFLFPELDEQAKEIKKNYKL